MKVEVTYKEAVSKKTGLVYSYASCVDEYGREYKLFDDRLKYAALAEDLKKYKDEKDKK